MFRHPTAGVQLVKGTLEQGETVDEGALRELFEESGLLARVEANLGAAQVDGVLWQFVLCHTVDDPPDHWDWLTIDDFGHIFSFFWHPVRAALPLDTSAIFKDALGIVIPRLQGLELQ